MTNYVSLLIAFGLSITAAAGERRLALTFDDAPNPSTRLSGAERGERLVKALRAANVPEVAFFVNTDKLTEEGLARLREYARAGHRIGNHTHAHPELNKTLAEDFVLQVRTADAILADLPGFTRWFRYPYLREGDEPAKRDLVRAELRRLGYFNAYSTINTYDWYLDELLRKSDPRLAGAIGEIYVAVMVEAAAYYDQLARSTLGRSPAHVMLLHENDLAAFFVADLVRGLRRAGWDLITPEEAYRDEIARYLTPTPLASNPGRIGEIALDLGATKRPWHRGCDREFLESLVEAARTRGAAGD